MSVVPKVVMTGGEEFTRALKNISTGGYRKVMRKALRDVGKVVAATARANAPRDTGRMADSIRVRAIRRSRRRIGVKVEVGTRQELGLASYDPDGGYYPFAVEYGATIRRGTSGGVFGKKGAIMAADRVIPARPFLRPAFDAHLEIMRARLRAAVVDLINLALAESVRKRPFVDHNVE